MQLDNSSARWNATDDLEFHCLIGDYTYQVVIRRRLLLGSLGDLPATILERNIERFKDAITSGPLDHGQATIVIA